MYIYIYIYLGASLLIMLRTPPISLPPSSPGKVPIPEELPELRDAVPIS